MHAYFVSGVTAGIMRTRRGCHELSARRFRSVRATMASGIAMPNTPPTMAAASCDAGTIEGFPRNYMEGVAEQLDQPQA